MGRDFKDVADELLEFILWAEDLKTTDGKPAYSFCVDAMLRFNREMATYKILHDQKPASRKRTRTRKAYL